MFDLAVSAPPAPPIARTTADPDRPAFNPATRPAGDNAPTASWKWLDAALDEVDYGIVLLLDGARVLHINHAARVELDADHPLQLSGNQLRARLACDVLPLLEAIATAGSHGFRRLLTLGEGARRSSVSVVPLNGREGEPRAVLVILEKRSVSESLSIQGFARSHGLTGAEGRVLMALCSGHAPKEVSRQLGVAISTIRTQIGSIRDKTGATSLRALVRQVAVLPPIKCALRS